MDWIRRLLALFRFAYLLAFFLSQVSPGIAEEEGQPGFSLDVQLEREIFSLSDEITVHLRAGYPSGYAIDLPALRRALIEYFGYGQPPFSLLKETVIRTSESEAWIDYQIAPSRTGRFFISFGAASFHSKEGDKTVHLLSPLKPLEIVPAAVDPAFAPPEPTYLYFNPLLPVEIDPMVRQQLMTSRELLERERIAWRNLFFLRKAPALLFLIGSSLFIVLMVFLAFRTIKGRKRAVRGKSARSILKELLNQMQVIRARHKSGQFSANDALVFYQKALVECFELRFEIPLASLTVEELKELLCRESAFQQVKQEDLSQLLEASVGIKFGKRVVLDQEAETIMDRSFFALRNIVKSMPNR
ncbi:hypothetical protein [Estrella lausannensis]|uniref:Putative membrane protein n=1 Tax=Estrella lausannensis TaxID=483423 RepID=A0A0H5DMN9_9BACT|nr:hypothetical protein [Estrella lausannensis]CRX37396.1 Putative membrane protein [Estrella lausannensis]